MLPQVWWLMVAVAGCIGRYATPEMPLRISTDGARAPDVVHRASGLLPGLHAADIGDI